MTKRDAVDLAALVAGVLLGLMICSMSGAMHVQTPIGDLTVDCKGENE